MSQFVGEGNQYQQKEVSESGYEYLLGEIMAVRFPVKHEDPSTSLTQRLDSMGFDIGYR
jgi:hypothetical protein